MSTSLPEEIARLYQLPLAEFTSARNALAKQSGSHASEIRALQKPPVAAWAINQLYWKDRDAYDRLVGAGSDLREAHAAVLGGKHGDVRSASKSHEEAIEAALKATLGILTDAGQPVTDATRQAIATTLRALPGTDPPGQLARTLQPGGFEMLAGLPVQNQSGRPTIVSRPAAPPAPSPKKGDAAAERRAKEAVAEAERHVRLAEHAMRREEFESARATRDAEKAEKAVDDAREAVKVAEEALAEAERAAKEAHKTKAAAEERAREAERSLDAAKDRAKVLRTNR